MDCLSNFVDTNICTIFTFCDSNTLGKLTKICKQYRYVIRNNLGLCNVLYGHDSLSLCKAAFNGDIKYLNYILPFMLHNNDYHIRLACSFAARGGHFECLKYLHMNGFSLPDTIYSDIIKGKSLDCFSYVFNTSLKPDKTDLINIVDHECVEFLDFLHWNNYYVEWEFLLNFAIENNKIHTVKYITQNINKTEHSDKFMTLASDVKKFFNPCDTYNKETKLDSCIFDSDSDSDMEDIPIAEYFNTFTSLKKFEKKQRREMLKDKMKRDKKQKDVVTDTNDIDKPVDPLDANTKPSTSESVEHKIINLGERRTICDNYLDAIITGNLEQVIELRKDHLLHIVTFYTSSLIEMAAYFGHLNIVSHLHEHGVVLTEQTAISAASENHMDILHYIYDHRGLLTSNVCKVAAENGHLEILQFLHERAVEWKEDTCCAAATHGHFDCLLYAHMNECPFGVDICIQAIEGKNRECIEYAQLEMMYGRTMK